MAITAIPIQPVSTASGNQYRGRRIIEEAAQTFKLGTVVATAAADGGVIAWAGVTVTGAVGSPIGISYEAASNLSATGAGAPQPNQPFTGKGATVTFGSVPNETSAVNIPHGAPLNDGRVGFFTAQTDVVYSATLGNAGNFSTWSDALLSTNPLAGLTLDTGGNFWYVDISKTNLVQLIGRDLRDPAGSGNRVLFRFIQTAIYPVGG
jgi:hypothetical protein